MDLMQEEDNVLDIDTDYGVPEVNSEDNNNKVRINEDNPFEVEPAGLCRSTQNRQSPERFNPGMGEAASKW